MIGKVIGGRYEIVEKLGEGGMANVYKAKCRILKRYISIKILKHELANDEEFVRKFKDEAMEVAKLSDSNIVNVYDIGTEGELHYIVMEYVDGKTLKQYISEMGALSVKLALDFSIQICDALIVAHEINLIHRDIKSQNILVSNFGNIKVTDFGIAKSADSATITNSGKILGSAYYISPEQARGNFVDCRSDIYSFGVVMYEMFTGKLPFMQGTPVNVALQHIQVEPVELIEINNKISLGINNLVIKCLQKNPSLRYQSVSEIKNDLKALQSNKKHMVSKTNINDSTIAMEPLKTYYSNSGKNKRMVKLAIVFAVLFTLIGGSVILSKILAQSRTIQVPTIVGKMGPQFQKELESLGLQYEVSGYVESDLSENFVIDTFPKPGSIVKKGSVVRIILSEGIEQIKVPDIINKTLDQARVILQNNQLKIGNIEERFSEVYEVGKIIVQNPSYDSEVDKNEEVDIIISKGSETRLVAVPEFVGLDVVESQNTASLNGISIDLKPIDTSDKSKDNKVFYQSIPKGVEIKTDVVVELSYYKYVEKKPDTSEIENSNVVKPDEENKEGDKSDNKSEEDPKDKIKPSHEENIEEEKPFEGELNNEELKVQDEVKDQPKVDENVGEEPSDVKPEA